MLDRLIENLAPHYCYGCGQVGTSLCDNCKYDITNEAFAGCLACGNMATRSGICDQCRVPYEKAWCVGERAEALERLIDAYKFEYVQAAHQTLAEMLLDTLDELPPETVIVPVSTIAKHIRQRGYDHTLLIARHVARKRNLTIHQSLKRSHTTVQRGASRTKRISQAKKAFWVEPVTVDPDRPYLLIDDVVTTGATLHYGALALQEAGVRRVWVAAIARQPLDEKG